MRNTFLIVLIMQLFVGPALQAEHGIKEQNGLPELIPREVLYGNPVKASPKISPDGTRLAYLAPSDKGVMNLWIRTLDKKDDKMVSKDSYRGIRKYHWLKGGSRLIYLQDTHGDENYHVFMVDLQSGLVRDLTPFQGVRAVNVMPGDGQLLVGLNIRNRQLFDMYRIDLETGAVRLDTKNPGDVAFFIGSEWRCDQNHVIRTVRAMNFKTGSTILRIRDGNGQPWRDIMTWPAGEIINGFVLSFTADNSAFYLLSGKGANTSRLLKIDAKTGKELAVTAHNKQCDLWTENVLVHPRTGEIQAVEFDYSIPRWQVLDPGIEKDFKVLAQHRPGHFRIVSRDRADSRWIVSYEIDNGPLSFWSYHRKTRDFQLLFYDRPALKKYALAKMEPRMIKARDGIILPSYLTLPVGVKPENLPMVLYVHGGPTARDDWGYHPGVQLLANRGYAVLQVNYRGSLGFGKEFQRIGNGQVGVGSMQHDLTDAVKWAVGKGYADPKRVAIMGISYGGYATLAGLAFTPELYACGIDGCGPSNIKTLFQSIPPYLVPLKNMFKRIFGDVENNEELNRRISPLFHVQNIRAPVLIAQGVNDPRCPIRESDQMVKGLRDNQLDVTYVVYSDEGHGFERPENKLDYWGRIEKFLGAHLGGRHQAYKKIKGSTGKLQ